MAETSPTPASNNAPLPPPPAPAPAAASPSPRPADVPLAAVRTVVPIRMLIITLSLAGFAACVTFAVGAQIFIVPAMTGQSQAIQVLQSQVRELRSEVRNLEEQLTEATEPQAASPAEPAAAAAPAPSPAPAPAPAK